MKKTLGILFILFVFVSCENQKSVEDYDSYSVKFAKNKFTAKNGEFSLLLPKGWYKNEDPMTSDTVLYYLESGPKSIEDKGVGVIAIYKMNLDRGILDNEFDLMMANYLKKVSNLKLLEKSNIKIGELKAKTAHFAFMHEGKITQEEIDIFIPISKNQYYYIGMVHEKNEHIDTGFGMMLECVRSFKLKK